MPVVIVGTLDTKGAEIQFVRDLLREAGIATLVVDAGVLQPALFAPDVPREQVFAAAKTSWESVVRSRRPRRAVEAAASRRRPDRSGSARRREVEGILGLGGSAGTTIATRGHASAAFRRAEADGQHAGQRPGQALRRRPRHPHAEFRGRHQRPEPHQPHRARQRGPRNDRHGSPAAPHATRQRRKSHCSRPRCSA